MDPTMPSSNSWQPTSTETPRTTTLTPTSDVSFLRTPFSAAIVARRGCGKTTLARYIVRALAFAGELGDLVVMSATAQLSGDWAAFPRARLHDYSEAALSHYIEQQKGRVERWRAVGRLAPRMTIVFDDQNSGDFHRSDLVRWLYANGRHLRCNVVTICQFPTMVGPAARGNLDYLMLGPQGGDGLKGLFELVAPPDGTSKLSGFKQWIATVTHDHVFACFDSGDTAKPWKLIRGA